MRKRKESELYIVGQLDDSVHSMYYSFRNLKNFSVLILKYVKSMRLQDNMKKKNNEIDFL